MLGNSVQEKQPASTQPYAHAVQFPVSGLSPGGTYNFDLMFCIQGGGTASVFAFGQSGTSPTLGNSGVGAPVVMTVESTPADNSGGCTIVKNTAGQGGGTGPTAHHPRRSDASGVFVPAQATITPTYTAAPTWVVDGL